MAPSKKNIAAAAATANDSTAAPEVAAPAASPATEPVVNAPSTDGGASTDSSATSSVTALARVNALLALATANFNSCKEILAAVKQVQKDVARLEKEASKRPGRRSATKTTATGEPRKPSGFAKPTLLSSELCDFLGLPHDSRLARTECTRLLNKYIKDNNLQDKEDKRTIQPDSKLQKVLKLDKNDKVTYFNLQRAIKHHFCKDTVVAAVTATAVTA